LRANEATRANCASIVYPGCIHGVSAVYPAYFWRHGRFLRDVATLYPVCIQCVSSVYSVCVQVAPKLPARPCCIQGVSRMSPCCIHGLLRIHGVSMVYPWCIPGVSRLFLIQRVCNHCASAMYPRRQCHRRCFRDVSSVCVPRAYPWCIQSVYRVRSASTVFPIVHPGCIRGVSSVYPGCTRGVSDCFSVMYPSCIHGVSRMYSVCIQSAPRPFVSSWRIQDASTVYPHFAEGAPNVCSVCIWGLAQRVSIVYSARIQLKRCSVRLWRPALGLFITQSARRLQAARVLRFQAECSRFQGASGRTMCPG
jgi:hypothetical protein